MFWMPMADRLHAAPEFFASAAVAALWQGAVIASVLGLGLRLAPLIKIHLTAAQRFAIWAAAFATVAGLPFLPLLARGGAVAGPASSAPPGVQTPTAWLHLDDRWALAIAAVWLGASLVRAAGLAAHSLRLRSIWRAASPVKTDARIAGILAAASTARLPRLARAAELCTTRDLDRPAVIGFFAPRILIPDWLFTRLTAAELEQVVLHEAEHLRRGDDWTNLLQKLALVLFPLNPALVWIERLLCREREMACDEGVIRRTHAPRAYAACLTSLAERSLEQRRVHALSLGAFERRSELVHRVLSILVRKPAIHPVVARALVLVSAFGLLVASVELARSPQMVAFVPATKPVLLKAPATHARLAPVTGDGDRAYTQALSGNGIPGLRAVAARAMWPEARHLDAADRDVPRRAAASAAESNFALAQPHATSGKGRDSGQRAVLLKAEMPTAHTERRVTDGPAGEAQFVVFAAWQEVGSTPRQGRQIADYDADASASLQASGPESQNADRIGVGSAAQIAVTRMVFLIASRPAPSEPATSAAGATTAHPANPAPSQPSAPAPASGWLVFQL